MKISTRGHWKHRISYVIFIAVPFILLSFCSKIVNDALDALDIRDAGLEGKEEDVGPQQTDEIPQIEEEPLLAADGGVSIKEAIGRKYGGAVATETDEVNKDHST